MSSPVLASALRFAELIRGPGAWSLLRKDTAPAAIAILGVRLRGNNRRLPGPDLIEQIAFDLDELRDVGQLEGDRTAQQYLKTWLDEGFVIRKPADARDETYELSQDALTAIRFIDQLASPQRTVTESRLETVLTVLHRLRVETDADVRTRLATLEAQRAQIDAQIEALRAGESFEVMPEDKAHERVTEAMMLLDALPEDFARVQVDLEQVNRDLHASLVEDAKSRGAVLEDVFAGVDLLQESDAGRSFTGFYSVLLDAARSSQVEEDIDELLDRDFARTLAPDQRRRLRRMLPTLHESATEIHQTMTRFSRNLRQFVRSRDFVEERRVHAQVRQAAAEVRALLQDTTPIRSTGFALEHSAVMVGSITGLRLHDPSESRITEALEIADEAPVDIEELREIVRRSEIDLEELRANIEGTLGARGDSSIAEVLDLYPATQGVASVVGLVVLAEEGATRLSGDEIAVWRNDDVPWAARVPRYLFSQRSLAARTTPQPTPARRVRSGPIATSTPPRTGRMQPDD